VSIFEDKGDWIEWSPTDFKLGIEKKAQKIKLCADANIPKSLVDNIKEMGIPVITVYDAGIETHSDSNVMTWVRKSKRVLITMDDDFWDDKRFPIVNNPGLIFLDFRPSDLSLSIQAFELVYYTFAKFFPSNWWYAHAKVRVMRPGYIIKMTGYLGKIETYAFRLKSGVLMFKQLNSSVDFDL
jgi:predicted nuclease of predicted toxin-antitoxin system